MMVMMMIMYVITPTYGHTGLQKSNENLANPFTENYKVLSGALKNYLKIDYIKGRI